MESSPRLFASDAAIRTIGQGLLARTLPRACWTHEAHLAACLWLVVERSGIDLDAELPGIIRRYNERVGGVNDNVQGYHDTITRVFLAGVRAHAGKTTDLPLAERVNALLLSAAGQRDWPLRFYSRERLFSTEARRAFVSPDLAPLPQRAERP